MSELISEIGKRWPEDYHDRTYRAAMRASPENLKTSVNTLRKQMVHFNTRADFHQKVARDLADRHEVEKYSDIPDEHDKHRALHHSNLADDYRRKESGAFWAHRGAKKAALRRKMLKDDPERGIYADFKESQQELVRRALKGKPLEEIAAIELKVRANLAQAERLKSEALLHEEKTFFHLFKKFGPSFHVFQKEHVKAESDAVARLQECETLKVVLEGIEEAKVRK